MLIYYMIILQQPPTQSYPSVNCHQHLLAIYHTDSEYSCILCASNVSLKASVNAVRCWEVCLKGFLSERYLFLVKVVGKKKNHGLG